MRKSFSACCFGIASLVSTLQFQAAKAWANDGFECDTGSPSYMVCDGGGACNHGMNTEDCLWTRSYLTGDWLGYRSCLKESGIDFTGNSTHFAFGVNGGIIASPVPALSPGDVFQYTGRGQYEWNVDLQKFGGLPYGRLLVGLQHWYGEFGNVSFNTGSFSPAVFPGALPPVPNGQGDLYMTDFVITQPLSEKIVVFAGKKNVIGAADQDVFAGGNGTHQFVNQAFIANPAFLLALPYTSFTTGVALPQSWGMISGFVYDPQDRTQDFFQLGDLFSQGVILGGEVKVNTNFFGLKGDQHAGGMWKKVDLTNLAFNEPPPGVYPYPTVPSSPTLPESYTLYYGFDQFLCQYGDKDSKGWGVFGRASISDANPTPIRYFLSLGVGGDSTLRCGKGDRWGLGWYYTGMSNEFGPIPQFVFGPRDGTGVELFYNFQVNKWMNLSPDVQYIRPEASAIAKDAFVYGLRMNVAL